MAVTASSFYLHFPNNAHRPRTVHDSRRVLFLLLSVLLAVCSAISRCWWDKFNVWMSCFFFCFFSGTATASSRCSRFFSAGSSCSLRWWLHHDSANLLSHADSSLFFLLSRKTVFFTTCLNYIWRVSPDDIPIVSLQDNFSCSSSPYSSSHTSQAPVLKMSGCVVAVVTNQPVLCCIDLVYRSAAGQAEHRWSESQKGNLPPFTLLIRD